MCRPDLAMHGYRPRTIIAIRIDSVDVASNVPDIHRTLNRSEAEAEGWFNGPPYAVLESVFDEDAIKACGPEPDTALQPIEP